MILISSKELCRKIGKLSFIGDIAKFNGSFRNLNSYNIIKLIFFRSMSRQILLGNRIWKEVIFITLYFGNSGAETAAE